MSAHCTHCGKWHTPKYPSQKLCLDCWIKREHAFERLAELERENERRCDRPADRPERVPELLRDIERLKADLTGQRAIAEMWRTIASQPVKSEPIPGDMRRLLVLLCHPDRHGGSQASNKATRWLLEQRA